MKKIIGYLCSKEEAKRMIEFQISPETNECLMPIYKETKL